MRRATINRISYHHFRALTLLLAAALAAGLFALVETKPAEAAFPEVNGQIAFSSTRHGNHEIYAMQSNVSESPSSGKPIRLTNNTANDYLPTYAPGGKVIAFVSNRDGDYDIYTMDSDGTDQAPLTFNSAQESNPDWSPAGGGWLAFESNRDGNDEIYATTRSDGTGQTNLTNNTASDQHPSYSPDGTKIAFSSNRNGNYEIYTMNSNGSGTPARLTNNSASDFEPVWSPDGTKIAFVSVIDGKYEIYTMNSNGTNQIRLTYNPSTNFPANLYDFHPAWSPDGKKIAFVSTRRTGNYELWVMNASSRENSTTNIPQRLTDNTAHDFNPDWDAQRSRSLGYGDGNGTWAGWSVHPDGKVKDVQGSWIVPEVKCGEALKNTPPWERSRAAPWVGMWGDEASTEAGTGWIVQVATISQCYKGKLGYDDGSPIFFDDVPPYAAYAELYHNGQNRCSQTKYPKPLFTVKPGDRMEAQVSFLRQISGNRLEFYLYIKNTSTQKTWSTTCVTDTGVQDDKVATWQGGCIVESEPDDPNKQYGGLAKFTTPIKFEKFVGQFDSSTGCAVNGKGLGTYSGYGTLFRYDMEPEAGDKLAETGGPPDLNGAFQVTWKKWHQSQ